MEWGELDIPDHWINGDSRISRLAKICKMSVPTLRAALPLRIPLDQLETYDDAETAWQLGCIEESDWLEWCYRFRDEAIRFSDLGKKEAVRYAELNGIQLPKSDRSPE